MPRFITLKQAAEETNLSYSYLRNLFLNGKVKGIRSGVKIMLNADDLATVLLSLCGEGGE